MPTYEFRCPDGTIIERVFKISEVPAEIPCPNGEGMATRMISGGAALVFKGSGFYITDYGKDGKKDQRASSSDKSESGSSADKSSTASSSSSSSSTSTSGASSSDSKPAASTPAKPKTD
jgi:putative FmdB family regulatory protein